MYYFHLTYSYHFVNTDTWETYATECSSIVPKILEGLKASIMEHYFAHKIELEFRISNSIFDDNVQVSKLHTGAVYKLSGRETIISFLGDLDLNRCKLLYEF